MGNDYINTKFFLVNISSQLLLNFTLNIHSQFYGDVYDDLILIFLLTLSFNRQISVLLYTTKSICVSYFNYYHV